MLQNKFQIDSHLATVLFDTRASHGFMSIHVVGKLGLETTPMPTSMVLDLPRVRMESRYFYPLLIIFLRG